MKINIFKFYNTSCIYQLSLTVGLFKSVLISIDPYTHGVYVIQPLNTYLESPVSFKGWINRCTFISEINATQYTSACIWWCCMMDTIMKLDIFLLKDFIQMLEQNNSTISLCLCRWSTNSLVKSFTKSNCNYLFQM